ncbi:Leo1-like protein-domain-containing protein [Xylaria sp. CBS 124048]|nr:Leo1-like protein-domain-containing protein [Xylaria sp. CBS 124048]
MSHSDDSVDLADEGGDLFGDDEPEPKSSAHSLDDGGLGSERDAAERRSADHDHDGTGAIHNDQTQTKEEVVMDLALSRHKMPKTKNGTLQTMRVPNFLAFNAREYNPDTYEPTQWDLDNASSDKPKGVVRFQKDPNNGALVSNTLVHRWSDGSLTITIGGDHYEIQSKRMASAANKPYHDKDDAHYYAASPQFLKDSLLTVGHITEQYTVLLSGDLKDEATMKLVDRMREAGRRPNQSDMIVHATRDPELQKREAEQAERALMKAQRKRENAAARVETRGAGPRPGLSINDLEGRRGAGASRKKGVDGIVRIKRRRPEYDSDDDLPSGTRRQDEYDRDDDFIAPSDSTVESFPESGVEEDDFPDVDVGKAPRAKKKQKVVKPEEDAGADTDADADAELDDFEVSVPAEQPRARRRNIIDDDDE